MLKRLEESLIRREENLREKSMKAGSENKKVEEIVFINAVKQELTKADIQERLKESEARRDEITRQRQQRQKEHQAKQKTAADKRKKISEEEAMRVRASLEKRSEAAELKRLETLKERQISAARVKEKEIRIKKNKEALAMKKREKMERKKTGGGGGSSGRWRKVGRGGGTQRSGSGTMISMNGSDIGQCTTDEEGDNSGMETIGQSMTPVRAGVDVMPCLVASTKSTKSMTSPMTPPSSPPGRQSRGGAGRSMFHVITGDETGESDVDDLLAGGGGELRSPRKRFRTALLNGETIDVASNAYDEAAEGGRGRGMDPIVVGAAVDSSAVVVVAEEEEENNNGVTNASSPNKKRNKKKKKGKSKSKSKSKSKRSNGGGKNSSSSSSSTGSSSVSSPKRTSGESSARGSASTTTTSTTSSSSSSATNEMFIAKQKVMRKRMKKLKDRLKKFSFRKTTLRCGDKAAECQEDGDDEGNGASANEGLYPDHEEKYNLTWEEGASASLKKGRSLLYVVLY